MGASGERRWNSNLEDTLLTGCDGLAMLNSLRLVERELACRLSCGSVLISLVNRKVIVNDVSSLE